MTHNANIQNQRSNFWRYWRQRETLFSVNCFPLLEMTCFICLLQKINEKPQVINDYEAGRAIPNQQILGKLERALGELQK